MQTLFDALQAAARSHPEHDFLAAPPRAGRGWLEAGCSFTFSQILSAAEEVAAAWGAKGWGRGHRVALALENHPAHVVHFLAFTKLGVTQIPVNPYYLAHELEYLISHAEPDAVVALPGAVAGLAAAGAGPILSCDPEALVAGPGAVPAPPRTARPGAPGLSDEIALIYTSGSTARPKGVLIDNDYAFSVGRMYAGHGGALTLREGEERLYVPLPYFHVNAGVNTLSTALLKKICLIVPDRFHAGSWWEDLDATRATAFHYLGIIPPALMKAPPAPKDGTRGLRFGLGAGIDPVLHPAFEARFNVPMVEVWGMTETGRFIAACQEPRQIGTHAFGRSTPEHLLARVVDDAGHEVPPGTEGELEVRAPGPNPRQGFFKGYFKDPAATEAAWRGDWFRTGDIVWQDDSGMLHFADRAKNMIRRSGENISAAEVENAVISCPEVARVAVIAVKDEMRDEEVMACIVPVEGAERGAALAAKIQAHAATQLAYYKVPAWISFHDSLPVTGTQKIRKFDIFGSDQDPRSFPGSLDLRTAKTALRRKGAAS